MKHFTFISTFIILIGCAARPSINTIIVNTVSNVKIGNDYEIVISKVNSDTRCPEGLDCIWAGEVELFVSVYKQKVFLKEEKMIVSFNNFSSNKLFLEKYISNIKIKRIEILPGKMQEAEISLKDYKLKIDFEK